MSKDEKDRMIIVVRSCIEVAKAYERMHHGQIERETERITRLRCKLRELEGGINNEKNRIHKNKDGQEPALQNILS